MEDFTRECDLEQGAGGNTGREKVRIMKTILNRLYVYLTLALVAIFQNILHESLHYATARMFGEKVLEFRMLTNGWLTSQVIYTTPMEQRAEVYWLVIAWLPAIVTTLIGFIVYFNRARLVTSLAPLNLGIWYVGVLFMTIDPVYFGILSWFMKRSDVNAAEILGWSTVPFQIIGLLVAVVAIRLALSWRQEARFELDRYRLPGVESSCSSKT